MSAATATQKDDDEASTIRASTSTTYSGSQLLSPFHFGVSLLKLSIRKGYPYGYYGGLIGEPG